MLILVRHAMPLVDKDLPPTTWRLSAEGKLAARRIGHLLPADAVLVSSAEPKASDTLVCATGRSVTCDVRLSEVNRPAEPFSADFRTPRLRYVAGNPPAGWERPDDVAARIDAVIADHTDTSRPLVLAGHGMAFTTWLAFHRCIDDPSAFWSGLRFPDVFQVQPGVAQRLLD